MENRIVYRILLSDDRSTRTTNGSIDSIQTEPQDE